LEALLKPPVIHGLTESLTYLSRADWRTILAKLRRAKLLAGEDPHNPGHLDTHPLVREHFGEQLQSQRSEAWKECNRRLYNYYRALAPQLPDSFREMEPLFLAVICGCNAGLFREALHEVYIPRIQRGDVYFAANVLGARRALLLVLVHFFEHARWGSPVETGVAEQSLTAEDQLFILTQAMLYLTATRAPAAPEIRICYEFAEPLCHSLNRPLLLYVALVIHFRFSFHTEKLTAAMRIAERVCALAEDQNNPALKIGAYPHFGIDVLPFGRFPGRTQIREEWHSNLALGGSAVSGGGLRNSRRLLSMLRRSIRLAFRRDGLLPSDDGRSDRVSQRAERYARTGRRATLCSVTRLL
jgi:hypothetical protein